MTRVEEIEKEIEGLEEILSEKDKTWDFTKPYDDYCEMRKHESKLINKLDRERRLIMPYELSDLPDFGHVMSIKDFIGTVNSGGFIDYDGFGHYVKDGKESNVEIYPSDVAHQSIRQDFDTIIWYNR